MSNAFVTTNKLRLDLKPSWFLAELLLIQEGFVLYALWLLPLPKIYRWIGTVCLLFLAGYAICVFALGISEKSITHLIEQSDEGEIGKKLWTLIPRNESLIEAVLMGETYSSLFLIVLLFKQEELPWHKSIKVVILMKDSVNDISWRRLRAYLTRIKIQGLG